MQAQFIGKRHPIDFVKVHPAMIAIVIGEGDVAQADAARVIGPGLE